MGSRIEDLVRLRYRASEGWLTLDEVSEAPGHYGRRLDLVAVGCWPSNARHLIGFEVKRTVADWRRELDQPNKRAPFVDEVSAFVFVAPWKVIDPKEVPEGCGLLSLNESGDLRMRVRAKQVKRAPSADFTAALFRAALRQIEENERATHRFADFKGRALSVEDLHQLAVKTGRYLARHDHEKAAESEVRERTKQRSREWRDCLDALYRFGCELVGDGMWRAKTEDGPRYAKVVMHALAAVRAGSGMQAATIAQKLRHLADQLTPPAAGVTA